MLSGVNLAPEKVLDCIVSSRARLRYLDLPYQSRSPDSARAVIEKYRVELSCGGERVSVLVFRDNDSLTGRLYVCAGRNISVRLRERDVKDVMSGLKLTILLPVIEVDDCTIVPRWDKSRFVLDGKTVSRCTRCFSVTSLSLTPQRG